VPHLKTITFIYGNELDIYVVFIEILGKCDRIAIVKQTFRNNLDIQM
jgi:hypothetical protein